MEGPLWLSRIEIQRHSTVFVTHVLMVFCQMANPFLPQGHNAMERCRPQTPGLEFVKDGRLALEESKGLVLFSILEDMVVPRYILTAFLLRKKVQL